MASLPVLRIAVPTVLRQLFDYLSVDPGMSLQPGIRLKVPFGRKTVVGVLLQQVNSSQWEPAKLKSVIDIIDEQPLLPKQLLAMMEWVADYYHHPIGEVIVGSLPKLLRQGRPLPPAEAAETSRSFNDAAIQLSEHQQQAVTAVLQTQGFQPFLLEGVTGSGKTEVYLQIIAEQLTRNKQALVLVPEISLTPQTVARFTERFAVPIAILHSGLTDKERLQAWAQAYHGVARIVIGTRSALFTPLPDLGVIILDESHDPSFKQQSGLRYSARDVAVKRAQLENIPVILGSATPSLESLHNVIRKKFIRLPLPERVGKAIHPTFHLIDLRTQKLQEGIAPALLKAIRQHLDNNGQVLLFLNRRGFAPVLLCHHCGWAAECKRCSARLTLHRQPVKLICHHCDSRQPLFEQCPACQQPALIQCGVGTERLEKILSAQFTDVPLVRIDRDTTRKKGTLTKLLTEIHSGQARLLLGTQMLAKGHHFPEVTMVGIIDGDNGLYHTDFRATERMAQLIMQVAGRAGRADKLGEVYIQTHNPEHPLLHCLLNEGYNTFAKVLLQERQQLTLPPFGYFVLMRAEAVEEQLPLAFLQQVCDITATLQYEKINLLGPIPAPMPKRAGKHRAQLLVRTTNRQQLQRWLTEAVPAMSALKTSRKVRWSVDVDPQEMC